ncbi:DUF3558 domain-containing protein [Allosaccharopolyspora coralli]|uniref:DUF3558 domain-containing protein n=1 Tax=Allosaccharopolyspora coralli TaxID=2665642 RepID=A0A5Q3QB84_9PSEU|nr:DUF3558 family protein [Allosaccharopolyspora coralli]QGK71643.1 DUF3558 domain-containing protein [Allosaccharopolyspora coralli]
MRKPAVAAGALALGVLAGCSGQEPAPEQPPTPSTETSEQPTLESVEPSITREIPQEQRQRLARLPSERLCELVTPDELGQLAFPVQRGQPREVGFDPTLRGCSFEAQGGARAVLLGAQPAGYGSLGDTEVDLGGTRGTQTLHVNDCTVFADVEDATLQVVVTAPEAGSDQCEAAQGIAQYTLAALVR